MTRAGSAYASLSALSLSEVTLAPVFATGTTAYTASVGHGVTETTVSATAAAGATYVVKVNGVVDRDGNLPLVVGSNVIAVEVTAEDGVSKGTYSVTVKRAGSSDASLSGLSLSGVTLVPAFVSGTLAYTASAGNGVTETTVSATAAAGATYVVKVNGVVDQDGVVPLAVGNNVIALEVTAEDGVTTGTYTVTVTRAGSSDASLSALSLSGVTLAPAFLSGTTAYTATVGNGVAETTVSATAAAGATHVVKLEGALDLDGIVPLSVGSNAISIEVTAQDGVTTGTYTVTVTRAGSGDASLSTLTLSGITLTPTFATGMTAYTASVGHGVTETTVSATAAAGATYVVKVNGVVDGDGIVPLVVGSNAISVEVTAQDGVTTGTYTVTVTRAGSGDASLASLSLSGVTLAPVFASGTMAYAASVGHAVTETTVSATAGAGAAYVVKVNGVVDGDGIVPLVVGSNAISVEVTAQDGVTTGTYTVTVTRAGSADASLASLSLSEVTLAPVFASGTMAYAASVGHAVTETTVSATAAAGAAYVVKVNGVEDQDGVVPLVVGSNVIAVVATAQDGVTMQTYTVTVTRAGSADASLSALSLSGVTLVPVFATGTTVYTASVANAVTETTVSATAEGGATYAVKLNSVVDADGVVPLAVGSNVIAVEVTAQDGVTTGTYTVTVTRAGSADASLSGLSLSGVMLAPAFLSGTMAYAASVGHAVTETTVSATAADAGAAFEVRLNGVVDGDGIVPLVVGSNVISVEVTAQDGVSKGTYTVTVTRAGSADASLSALSLSGVTLVPVFASGTTAYTALVAHSVTETTVSATAAEGATTVVKLAGIVDEDGIVPFAVGNNVIALEVTAQDGVTTQTYSVTVTRAGSADASLSTLTLSGVLLAPAFASGTSEYTASVGNEVTETTVSASAVEGAAYVVKVNGVEDQDGIVPLVVGSNAISVEVTAQDGETTQTYTVTVTRAGSGDASLASLSLSGVTLEPVFALGTTTYTASVVNGVTETTVSASAVEGAAYVVKVNGVEDQDGIVPLVVGSNVISVEVTAQDGVTKQTYSVTVTRAGSGDASLSTLTLSGLTLAPAFLSGTLAYTASVGNDATQTTVAVTAVVGAAYVVKVNGVEDQDGIVPLVVGSNVIAVEVTAQDGETTQTYSVTVTRAGSADASLSGLSLSGVTLDPVFDAGTAAYTATVETDVTETTVSVTLADAGAAYEVRLDGVVDLDGIVPLAVGSNVVAVVVTAQDGETIGTYTVMVTRVGSGDASLSGLSLSGVTLDPVFDAGTTAYTATVETDVTETTVSVTLADAGAAYEVRLDGVVDLDGIVPLAVGSNVVAVVVTAQDGKTERTYTVSVTRKGSGDASLAALSLSGVTLDPVFASGTTEYTALVETDVTETTVSVTLADAGAAYEVRLDGVVDLDGIVPLAVGSNVITVVVTAQDGQTIGTYTVMVTRVGSGDASLASLAVVSGAGAHLALEPPFVSGQLDYAVLVAYGVEFVTVSGLAGDTQATVTVTPRDSDAVVPGHQVDLIVGANVVRLDVTAQDGVTTAQYVVRVTRQEEASSALKSLEIGRVTLVPVFSPETLLYKAEVDHDVRVMTVYAETEDAAATAVILLDGVVDGDGTLALGEGVSVVQVVVTSRDGAAETTYTVAVTRVEEQLAPLPTPVRPSDAFESQRSIARPTPTPTPTPTAVPVGIGISDSFLLMESSGVDGAPVEATLEVWNRGSGRMVLNLSDDAPWLKASPSFVVSVGPQDRKSVTLTAETWFLGSGSHTATVYVHVNEMEGSLKTISLVLAVAPKPTPTPSPTPTLTPTPSPTATIAAMATPAAPPTPSVVPTVKQAAAVALGPTPGPTPGDAPDSVPAPPTPTRTPQPAPSPVPAALPTPGVSLPVGDSEAPDLGGGPQAGGPEASERHGVDSGSGSESLPGTNLRANQLTDRFSLLYSSDGPIDYRRPFPLILVFFLIDVILKLRRKLDRFHD